MTKDIANRFTFEFKRISYTVEYWGKYVYDPSYGADADGNRGTGVWLQDELSWVVINTEGTLADDPEVQIEAERRIEEEIDDFDFS